MAKNDETNERSIIGPAVDEFRAAVPWTKNRMVIVYHRRHAGREYIRLRTFNRHQVKGCWYPAPRFYMVPIEHAEELGSAIIAAGRGRSPGPMPEWYVDFEKQYKARADANGDAQAFWKLGSDAGCGKGPTCWPLEGHRELSDVITRPHGATVVSGSSYGIGR